MSTRSCIILKVRKEDIGKVMKFNAGLLPVPLDRWEDKDHEGKVWRDETGRNRCRPVEINDLYIGIYCHWDGYLSGVGDALKERFNDYDSALNLIIGGSCSYIANNMVRHYANRKKEKWSWIYPKQGKTQKSLVDLFNHCWCEFAYLFDESRGGWSYKTFHGKPKNINKRGFKLMK